MAIYSLKGKRKIELERCCAVCYGFSSKAKAVGATMSHSKCNKKNSNTRSTVLLRYFANKATAWYRRGFHTTLWLSDLLSLCSILFFGWERIFVIIIIFCFVLNCKANNSCSRHRRQRCRFLVTRFKNILLVCILHISVYRVCCSSCTMQLCILLLQSVWIETSKL